MYHISDWDYQGLRVISNDPTTRQLAQEILDTDDLTLSKTEVQVLASEVLWLLNEIKEIAENAKTPEPLRKRVIRRFTKKK